MCKVEIFSHRTMLQIVEQLVDTIVVRWWLLQSRKTYLNVFLKLHDSYQIFPHLMLQFYLIFHSMWVINICYVHMLIKMTYSNELKVFFLPAQNRKFEQLTNCSIARGMPFFQNLNCRNLFDQIVNYVLVFLSKYRIMSQTMKRIIRYRGMLSVCEL